MNLLRQVFRGLTPAEPPRPQYYRVACPEGHVLQGQRTEGYQALRCPTCGGGIFVLPRSPLPEPPEPAARARPRAVEAAPAFDEGPIALTEPPRGAEVIDADVEWEDEVNGEATPDPEPTPPLRPAPRPAPTVRSTYDVAQVPAAPRPASRPAPTPRAAPPSRPEPEPEPEDEAPEWEEEAGSGRRRTRRRLLTLFVGVAAMVVVAVGVRFWRQKLQDLPKVVEVGRVEGVEALDQGRFDEAKELLSKAARAADALGGQVEGSQEVRDAAREAAIYADLVPESLETILDEMARVPAEEREAAFARRYRGRSVVVDARVENDPDGIPVVGLLIANGPPGQLTRSARIDLANFGLYESVKPAPNESFVFGARLAGVKLLDGKWHFLMEPESGVLLKHDAALGALGMSPTDRPEEGNAP